MVYITPYRYKRFEVSEYSCTFLLFKAHKPYSIEIHSTLGNLRLDCESFKRLLGVLIFETYANLTVLRLTQQSQKQKEATDKSTDTFPRPLLLLSTWTNSPRHSALITSLLIEYDSIYIYLALHPHFYSPYTVSTRSEIIFSSSPHISNSDHKSKRKRWPTQPSYRITATTERP